MTWTDRKPVSVPRLNGRDPPQHDELENYTKKYGVIHNDLVKFEPYDPDAYAPEAAKARRIGRFVARSGT